MTHPIVAARRVERTELIERARGWAWSLADEIEVVAVVVVGSVARGDFNKWSDLDVLVIGEALPAHPRERLDVLRYGAPPGLQPIGWSSDELARRRRRHDPIAVDAATVGVTVRGALPHGD